MVSLLGTFHFFVRADPGQSELHPAFVEALNKDLNFILRAGAAQ